MPRAVQAAGGPRGAPRSVAARAGIGQAAGGRGGWLRRCGRPDPRAREARGGCRRPPAARKV